MSINPNYMLVIEKIIEVACVKKSCSVDEMPCNMLKFVSNSISHVVNYIINVSFKINKKGNQNLISN